MPEPNVLPERLWVRGARSAEHLPLGVYFAFSRQDIPDHVNRDPEGTLYVRADYHERVVAAVVELAIPYEALLMDKPSRKWIAPEIWAHIERAVKVARELMATFPPPRPS